MLSIRRLIAVTRKEFRHITRDPRTFFLVTIAPAFLLVTFSYIFVLDVGQSTAAVRDLDQSDLSRELVARLTADGDFVLTATIDRPDQVQPLFARGQADVVLVIPRGFADTLRAGRSAQVQAIVDGSDAITANQAMTMLQARLQAFGAILAPTTLSTSRALEVDSQVWYNPALESLISMVPGLMAVMLCMPALAMALALARERETGSFEGLIATPVRGVEYLAGKLLAYESSGMVSIVLAWLMARLWFGVPFRGSPALFLLLSAGYLATTMGISMLVTTFVHTQQTVMFLILMIFFVPSFFVAGLISPVAEQPLAQALAYALPTTHFIAICRAVFLKALTLSQLWRPTLALALIGIVTQAGALLLFKKRVR